MADDRYGRDRSRDAYRGNYDAYRREDDRGYGQRGPGGYGGYAYGGSRDDRRRDEHDYRARGADERGFFDRAADEVRSWFGDEAADRRRHMDERRDPQGTYHYHSPMSQPGSGFGNQRGDQIGAEGWGQSQSEQAGYGGYQGYAQSPSQGERWHHDEHYRGWREQQMQQFDRDYEEFRRARQSQFDSEFERWRAQRQVQHGAGGSAEAARIREHMEVVGSDGGHVGTVDHVQGDRIRLTRQDPTAQGHHHSISLNMVRSVEDKVRLDRSSEEVMRQWQAERE